MKTSQRLSAVVLCALAPAACVGGADAPTVTSEAAELRVGRTLTVFVSPDGDDAATGQFPWAAKRTIQAAIDATRGTTARSVVVEVAPGRYTGTIDIENRENLTVAALEAGTVTVQPAAVLGWNVASYGTSRTTPVRVVGSRGVNFRQITFDFADVHGDLVAGLLYWNSSGALTGNTLRNMSAAGYYEFTTYFSAPDFTDATRATISLRGNRFERPGRTAATFQWYTRADVRDNVITTADDFGYGLYLAGPSDGVIANNQIAGFHTRAATDGSASAGIYVDNAFTRGLPSVRKRVTIQENDIRDCNYGVTLGNGFAGLGGDTDLDIRLKGNTVQGATLAGVNVIDVDRSAGSSVRLTASDNEVTGSAGPGYQIATQGDAEVHATILHDLIRGNDVGVHVQDDQPGALHDITVRGSWITQNAHLGLSNAGPSVVNARGNWWGSPDGPSDTAGSVELVTRGACGAVPLASRVNLVAEDSGRLGNGVSDNVDVCGWVTWGSD